MTADSRMRIDDTPELRKERGAFFTPADISRFIANWAIRRGQDRVLEPSAGDAAFLVAAVERMAKLSRGSRSKPNVDGVEIHSDSVRSARRRVRDAGGLANIRECDFFDVPPSPIYDVVIGNPPYIRYQSFSGLARVKSRQAALRGGVSLTGLASSWAAFTVHSALFLKAGGRLGLVLPAELLSVNYASPVRQFLFERFKRVELVLFSEQVFKEAEADVVLLLAEGYGQGPAGHALIRQAKNAASLATLDAGQAWKPVDPAGKWTSSLVDPLSVEAIQALMRSKLFVPLESWGDTTLGIVTGNNGYFTMSPARARELGLRKDELLPLSPPGSAHLRGLALTYEQLRKLGKEGLPSLLFYPGDRPSAEAKSYIDSGKRTGVASAYKCRVRKVWHRVPLVKPADLLLTCMNADTPRLTTNEARAYHLNSVHGVYLSDRVREVGSELLPLASLNSVTLMHAEMVGRAYGGGILKLEPKEADLWAMPSATLISTRSRALRAAKGDVMDLLGKGDLLGAVELVDSVMLASEGVLSRQQLERVRRARAVLADRREARSNSGR